MLTAKQKQFLRGLAHPLAPIVRVGRHGVTPAVVEETKKSLLAHELIKVRFDADDAEERQSQAEFLAEEAEAQIAGRVGKIAIVYRRREEKPKIKLPKATGTS
ncbi:MAG TPA: ribosome assembly RNA-binding protein YhbY [Thermoanaerobaculia bacterium]|nr:ribosome assembly RNA-binding protein YhbY [Thermoanaerobaculia bacterium]